MRSGRVRTLLGACILLLALTVSARQVWAQSVDVSIGVGDTTATINGRTSPGAFVTIKDSGSTVASVVADGVGNFAKQLVAQTPGIHDLAVSSLSAAGHTSDTTFLNVSYADHTDTPIGMLLAPTLIVPASVSTASSLNIHGETFAGAIVQIYVDQKQPVQAYAAGDGTWSLSLPGGSLTTGNHTIFAVALDGLGGQSTPTSVHGFTISSPPPVRSFSPLLRVPVVIVPVSLGPTGSPSAKPKVVQVVVQPSTEAGEQPTGGKITIVIQAIEGSSPFDYLIQWGDGDQINIPASGTPIRQSHTYKQTGTYHGRVRITDANGTSDTNSFDVRVNPVPQSSGARASIYLTILILTITSTLAVYSRWFVVRRRMTGKSGRIDGSGTV